MNLKSLYIRFASIANWLQSPLLFVIRAYWGVQFVLTGWGKVSHLDKIANYFESLHLPLPKLMATMAGGTELIGGALLALGFLSRAVSLALTFTMCVAYATAEKEELAAIFTDPDKFTGAAPFLFLLASLIILAFGPGAISVDRFIFGDPSSSRKS